jgi:hypothetical protein
MLLIEYFSGLVPAHEERGRERKEHQMFEFSASNMFKNCNIENNVFNTQNM